MLLLFYIAPGVNAINAVGTCTGKSTQPLWFTIGHDECCWWWLIDWGGLSTSWSGKWGEKRGKLSVPLEYACMENSL